MGAVLRTHELTKHYRHPFFTWVVRAKALSSLTLQIEAGEVFGLLGPNGSGKSTTIKLLLGLIFPTSGWVQVFGGPPERREAKARTGYLPEESYLYPSLNASETLDFYGRLFALDRRERQRRCERLLELVGLSHVRTRPVGEFSKGMQRRLGLAQCLINDPELVVLDEPTTGLDPLGTAEIKGLIRQLRDKGKTVLLCSHLLGEVEDVCDRAVILYGGRVRAEGTIRELVEDRQLKRLEGRMSAETLEAAAALIREREPEAELEAGPSHRSLEKLFLETVARAQAERAETSGARVEGEQRIDFLSQAPAAQAEPPAGLLERLAQDDEPSPAPAAAPPAASPAAAAVSAGPEDHRKLEALTTPAEPPVGGTPGGGTPAPRPAPPASPATPGEATDHALLDRLAGGDD